MIGVREQGQSGFALFADDPTGMGLEYCLEGHLKVKHSSVCSHMDCVCGLSVMIMVIIITIIIIIIMMMMMMMMRIIIIIVI